MAGRASFGQITEADFSSLLQALSATAKGRLFLAEYRRRSRPEDTFDLLNALSRIEATIGTVRDQLQPERIADELRRVSMTIEIAVEGAEADPEGDETARRMALIDRARLELAALAGSLAGELAPPPCERVADDPAEFDLAGVRGPEPIDDDLAFLDQLVEGARDPSAER